MQDLLKLVKYKFYQNTERHRKIKIPDESNLREVGPRLLFLLLLKKEVLMKVSIILCTLEGGGCEENKNPPSAVSYWKIKIRLNKEKKPVLK